VEGVLHVSGRTSDVIITGGENVQPAEVDRVLEQVPFVASACVFGVEDAVYGERVAVALVVRDGDAFDPEALSAHAERHLAAFKRPRLAVVLDALPTGPSGKVDRKKTADLARGLLRPLGSK
jgi:O-succinylbenzoic acid--CoA ligase